jgi:hypothetical protein
MAQTLSRDPARWAAWIHTMTQEVGIKDIIIRTGIKNIPGK